MAKTKSRKHRKYSEEQRQEAITIALASSGYKAQKETGIPAGTIRNWIYRSQAAPETAQAASEAIAEGKERAAEMVAERMSALALQAFDLAEKAIAEATAMVGGDKAGIIEGPLGGRDADAGRWLHSVIGAFGQATEKALLLSGKPTGRLEQLTTREEGKRAIIEKLTSNRALAERALPILREIGSGNGHRPDTTNN